MIRFAVIGYWVSTVVISVASINCYALGTVRISTTVGADASRSLTPQAVAGCPSYSGVLDSISVPVNKPLTLYVLVDTPAPPGGASFQLKTDDASLVSAGDPTQAFYPTVSIAPGRTTSNSFQLFAGSKVGKTVLRIIALTPGYNDSETPLTAWDLNPGAPADKKFLDANPPVNSCRASSSSTAFSGDPSITSRCGKNVEGVSADGLSKLLLRVGAGLPGTACFEIVSQSAGDQGSLDAALKPMTAAGTLQYASTYFSAPKSYGNSGESRQVEAEITYTPNIGNGNTSKIRYKTTIVRPPVLLVHGLWGSANSFSDWTDYQPEGDFRVIVPANYQATNNASFATNRATLKPMIDEVLARQRRRFAATRVDLIGHSMGGILSRLHVGSSYFKAPANLNQGDVRRLLTLDTPHYGSSFANLIIALHRSNSIDTDRVVRDVAKGTTVGGAVCDLAENSPGLQLGELSSGTSLLSQVYTATGGDPGLPSRPASFFTGKLGQGNLEGALVKQLCSKSVMGICTERDGQFIFDQGSVNAFRFREANDTIVALSSQAAGIAIPGANFPDVIHSGKDVLGIGVEGMTNSRAVATAAFRLMDGPDSGFQAALGGVLSTGSGEPRTVPGRGARLDQNDYTSQCAAGGSLAGRIAANGKTTRLAVAIDASPVSMIAPANGSTVVAGSTVMLVGKIDASFNPLELGFSLGAGIGYIDATGRDGDQFTANFVVPSGLTEAFTVTPNARDLAGKLHEGSPTRINVIPQSPLTRLSFLKPDFQVAPGAAVQQLTLLGSFGTAATPVRVDVTNYNASFVSTNTGVASVDATGRVSVGAPGLATITASYQGLTASATFIVENPEQPLPPQDVTGSFVTATSGLQLNRSTGFFVQTITLSNRSQNVLPYPLYLAIPGLPTGVSLVGASVGLSLNLAPVGTPYLAISLGNRRFEPGQTISLQLQFLNPSRAPIAYQPAVFWTDAQP